MSVPFQAKDAQDLSAQVANDAVAFLDTYGATSSVKQARDSRIFLEKLQREADDDLAATQQRLVELQEQNRILAPDEKAREVSGQVTALTEAHNQALVQVRDGESSLEAVRKRLPVQAALRVEREVTARNPMIVKLEGELLDLEAQAQTLLAGGALPTHPDVAALQDAIKAKRAQLSQVAADVQEQVSRGTNPVRDALTGKLVEQEVALAGARSREQVLKDQLAVARVEMAELPPIMREYADLTRQAQTQGELAASIAKRVKNARIEEQREDSGRFQMLDPAEPPLHKAGPSTVRSMAIAFLVLLVILGLANAYQLGWISLEDDTQPNGSANH